MPSDKKLSALASSSSAMTKDGLYFILRFYFISQLDGTRSHPTISTRVVGLEKTYMEHIMHRQ